MKSQDIGHLVKEEVLIVAKCIVNLSKFIISVLFFFVLIVAKCIVNSFDLLMVVIIMFVLIVAKCIVNDYWNK